MTYRFEYRFSRIPTPTAEELEKYRARRARFWLEYNPIKIMRPVAIWDHEIPDGWWWRQVADFTGTSTTYEQARRLCALLNAVVPSRAGDQRSGDQKSDQEIGDRS